MLIKGWQLPLCLGLAAMSQQTLASAEISREQAFRVGSVDLSLGVGVLNGQGRETVYDVDRGGRKLSQLNWDIKLQPTLHLGLAYHPTDWLSLEARGWTRIANGNGHMKDYDWLDERTSDWTDYSTHPDTRVQKAWQAELAATLWLLKREDFALGALLGYQRSEFGWQTRGGSYTYSYAGRRDMSGEFPDDEKGISYQQTYSTPYIGLVGAYRMGDWALEGRFKYSQWVKSGDFDTHHMRDLTFRGERDNAGRMHGLAMALSWQATPNLSLKAGVDYQVHAESKGGTMIHDLSDGSQDWYGGNSGGQSMRTVLSSLSVGYRF
ncbi:omptin family outer membrane protease [Pseudomonas sp. NPDC090202]|uniref:omptin family outer membrane protease n=1 Tax=unclassified Pseudomonas TaxID=196821 RepID=UPI0037F7D03E